MAVRTLFPIQRDRGGRLLVPWNIGEEAWQAYHRKYHNHQTAEIIADRGGFGEEEMDTFRPGWREFIVGGEQVLTLPRCPGWIKGGSYPRNECPNVRGECPDHDEEGNDRTDMKEPA